ncbi:hypothetical protein GCM10010172_45730 [Paractinoplanes ferrugineus]|uniref:Nudix hydrolase domain-containing protein n=1 Tax=Paractinoplanes ferrugineus TaxID=113564 RepID=A0A919J8N6_9ACTN|nr:NUDIX hydrolase [Actinoplanes ferrugineus]GIE15584.1 hypothetical protein Afe05nite_74240 [Actinoplanes ferrugineus]
MDDDFRRSRYAELLDTRPEWFTNPPGAPFEILTDPGEIAEAEAVVAARLARAGRPASEAATGVVYADQYGMVVRDAVRAGGDYGTYRRYVAPDDTPGVVVLPRFGGDVVLLRHFRHSTRDWHLELPRGDGTPGADPADDARRELREEIGADAATLRDLGAVHADTGLCGTPVRLFHAELAGPPVVADAGEGIAAVELVTPAVFAGLIADETITDGFTINAYARAALRGLLS